MYTDCAAIAIDPESEVALALRRAVESGEPVRVAVGDIFYELDVRVATDDRERRAADGIERAAGGWQGLIDFDAFLEDLYERRRMVNRPPVNLDP